tara:strand:- start:1282 stop:1821 length:540 start_codon:yes stop_codon:yes gene_type:complete
MFSIPFYKYKIDNWKEKKQKLLEICSTIDFKNQEIETRKNISAYADNLYTDYGKNNLYTDDVVDILKSELIKFKDDVKIKNIKINNAWFQQYYKSQFHSPHSHGALGYSSVTYIKFDKKKHQPTIFISPFNDPLGNLIEYAPEVDEGHIIFFPSMITHYVQPNKSNDIRIILSFNVNLQ